MPSDLSANDIAWGKVFADNPDILETALSGRLASIEASTIRKHREPRLMTKFDTKINVAQPLKSNGLDILANSWGTYVIGKFSPYHRFPTRTDGKPTHITLPDLETLRIDSLTSEAKAINALTVSGALERFLGVDRLIPTFDGRMRSDDFSFDIASTDGGTLNISVHAAQLEIDAGFETDNAIVIMEAKNVIYNDFNVRQLYYPYRKYFALVEKPIRLVFSQYTNLTYHLYEYEFWDPFLFSSIQLVRSHSYTFADTAITWDDLRDAWLSTSVITDDDQRHAPVAFIQADRFDRVISLLEKIEDEGGEMLTSDIAEFVGVVYRQADYYPASGEYLGLFDRSETGVVKLTPLACGILSLGYRSRQLAYVSLMFQHEIFHQLFDYVFTHRKLPSISSIVELMARLNVCNEGTSTIKRRASTVRGWLRWIMGLVEE